MDGSNEVRIADMGTTPLLTCQANDWLPTWHVEVVDGMARVCVSARVCVELTWHLT